MKLTELIWMAHGMEMKDAIDAISMSKWNSEETFHDIVDIETSALIASIMVDGTFNEYSDEDIQAAIAEIIEDYIEF